MNFAFFGTIVLPLAAGATYFVMASEILRFGRARTLIFGEIGYKKFYTGFLLFGIYLVTRPLQNLLGPHPWPMLVNCFRQFFLMAVIAPAIFVGILHWASGDEDVPKTVVWAAYSLGFCMAVIFILVNAVAIDGSAVIAGWNGFVLHDPVWFTSGARRIELVLVHLVVQSICPVGFFLLAAGYVRNRRHNYPADSVYNQMTLKWRYLETGLIVLSFSFIIAGLAAFLGRYFTYLWVSYYTGSIISGLLELHGVKLPPRSAPSDLKD